LIIHIDSYLSPHRPIKKIASGGGELFVFTTCSNKKFRVASEGKKRKWAKGEELWRIFYREKGKRHDSFAGGAFARTKNLEKRSEWSTA
jgi:hypothetical protein